MKRKHKSLVKRAISLNIDMFYLKLLKSIPKTSCKKIPTIAICKKPHKLYYNLKWLKSLSDEEFCRTIKWELNHVIMQLYHTK